MIRVFDSQKTHYYQPGWTMVGGVFPENNKIQTDDGREWTYDQLIIAAGMIPNFNSIKGINEALLDDQCPVGSIYSQDYAVKFSNLVDKFQGGNVIFTEPLHPIKCAGAPQKIIYLTEERIHNKKGIREKTNIEFYKAVNFLFSVPRYSSVLTQIIKQKNIKLNLKTNLLEVRSNKKIAVFEDLDTKSIIERPFDLLHVVPPHIPPPFIRQSGLGEGAGYVEVDKHTLNHKTYKNVWAIGDCSNLPTSKTVAAVISQTPILVKNLIHCWRDKGSQQSMPGIYEGYTSCPIFTGNKKVILAEFKYDGIVDETFSNQQNIPFYSFYFMKKYIFPFAYWNLMPKGIWMGRNGIKLN
ncbi:hypothetical protein IMG5_138190 [Ichthyophthirius multifiliis]|uniref:Sulfide:quinone oxidoreductase, mitochondrial n=1 Tax=Ichthyophthirius multifiliis TaxID=5932 RepID=G0QX54_ICHMU|nr:hypothetical protein IMG5_138190 [Ichthyophthirius multifiliis]EGR30200.1 hypothetical protein IMG5_138190 [Ichthyophthirius multifiliis]|eukprot:XP_004031796.1 hypothetical protein IMG5_138190 [Ichthyophthirius multifiliis]